MNLNETQALPGRRSVLPGSTLLLLALAAGGVGCYRASGLNRPTALASQIPATGGDRVKGNKAEAGPGDYFMGNDFVELAVDGAPFGERAALAGAASGGSIVDASYVSLDTSFHRVSMPGDVLERLTPVVNQDPDLPLVFDQFLPANDTDARLDMVGGVYDPQHKLAGVTLDGRNRVVGLKATHSIVLGKTDRYFQLTTTLTNTGSSTLPIRNIADHLAQKGGGGFRPVIPATNAQDGSVLTNWGVDFPGTDATRPLSSSVLAPMVGLMGAEPGDETGDSHASLGFLPVDTDQFLVASDAQSSLSENRPRFAQRVTVGSLPVAGLGAGQSIVHHRRIYLYGGNTRGNGHFESLNSVFNVMTSARATLRNGSTGVLIYKTFGTAIGGGALPAELRVERNTGGNSWVLERVEWREPKDYPSPTAAQGEVGLILPAGTYRLTMKNRLQTGVFTALSNSVNVDRPTLQTPILVEKDKNFYSAEPLAPEREEVIASDGNPAFNKFTQHIFYSRAADGATTIFQPLRLTYEGRDGTADPSGQRRRSLGSTYDPLTKAEGIAGTNFGAFLFEAGNGAFGTSMKANHFASAYFVPGSYRILAIRGPLSRLESIEVKAYDGQENNSHEFTVFQAPLPTGWTAFDLPAPSQASGGGMLAGEQLSSALAEGISVIVRTELDRHSDSKALRDAFRMEFTSALSLNEDRAAIGEDPFVIAARSSELAGYGSATALFTAAPTSGRAGGARPSTGWTLADFLTQAEGSYSVIHRPRGPQGLFTQKAFDRQVPLGTGSNLWWSSTGPVSLGKTHGAFDALELLRAEGFDAAHPSVWFDEFKAVRADWFALLKQQTPTRFTKGLGLSAALYSLDNPVGHARTYLKLSGTVTQDDPSAVLTALKAGAAVASTGPLLDVTANGVAPGGLASASGGSVTLTVNLYAPDWVPVEQVRIVVNGEVVQTLNPASFTASGADFRLRTTTVTLTLPATKDAFLVVEAGVPLDTVGAYRPGTPWAKVMRGLYPMAVTNPIFLDLNGGGYTPPGL